MTPRKVALIQLCYLAPPPRPAPAGQAAAPHRQHECLLLHIAHSGITPHLRRLLCSEVCRGGAAAGLDTCVFLPIHLLAGHFSALAVPCSLRNPAPPPPLHALQAVLKVGVGAHGDALKVCRDFGFEMQGVVCLSEYANARLVRAPPAGASPEGPAGAGATAAAPVAGLAAGAISSGGSVEACPQLLPAPQKWSLAALVSHLMRLRLEKSQGLRCSNW